MAYRNPRRPAKSEKSDVVTLQHIGDKLGLSRTTISLALRDHTRISTETKKKVAAMAKRLGYEPDQIARTLATGRSNLIGVVVPNTADHVYAEVFRGIEDAAQKASYNVLLSNGSYNSDHTARRVQEMMKLKVAGVIAAPPFDSPSKPLSSYWKEMKRSGFPVVMLNRELIPPVFHQVTLDNKGGIRLAMEALKSLGHKRVAYVTGAVDMIPIRQRLDAFRQFSEQYGFDRDPELIESSELSARGGYESCSRLWNRLRKKPTAIMVFSDTPALGVMRCLAERSIRIPEQVSVLGYDGTDSSEYSQPSLSTVATPLYEMGREAFQLLTDEMERRHSRPQSVVLPPRLILRESVTSPGAKTAAASGQR
jgi:DNA-binding LacI/PurR family transcriptional regulator